MITDRVDRRKAMVAMDCLRAVLTAFVAIVVLGMGHDLPDPTHIEDVVGTRTGLYVILVVSSLLLGFAEVLRDNSAQTIIPSIVEPEQLEVANGRMWSAEQVANTFVGPPLGSVLIAGAFFLPFAVDAVSFAAAAGLVALIVGQFKARQVGIPDAPRPRGAWKEDLQRGLRWLWRHPLLRPMAIILGVMNGLGAMQVATLVLFAQEVLHTVADGVRHPDDGRRDRCGGRRLHRAARSAAASAAGRALWLTLAVDGARPDPDRIRRRRGRWCSCCSASRRWSAWCGT